MTSMQNRLAQTQVQIISPRLQQQVRLLQLSSQDFLQEMRALLNVNPFLEAPDSDAPEAAAPVEGEVDPWSGMDWDRAARQVTGAGETDALSLIAEPATLAGHLHAQLRLLPLGPRDLVLAQAVVDSLEDDGRLRTPLDEIAACVGLQPPADEAEMRIALRRVQSLEPCGVAARSLQECLLLQARDIADDALRPLARAIIESHLARLASMRDATALAKALGAPAADVERACACIRRMSPRPGAPLAQDAPRYITPDVIVRKVRGAWTASLNPAVVPRFRLNQAYADLFERHRDPHATAMANQLQEARWAMRCARQRCDTILEVAKSIVRRQEAFFEFGEMAIKPMALKDVAQEVGVHESTVSRVTNNKYAASVHGVLELKHFFSRGLATSAGKDVSGKAVRELVLSMIRQEAPGSPLSDADIARQLKRQGLTLCRRTVTKYRLEMRIPAAGRRHGRAGAASSPHQGAA